MKALIFDLDGTLIDSVYAHTFAWQKALSEFGLEAPAYSIHRRIGMSGALLVKAIAREHGNKPLPGAKELLGYLHKAKIAHGIATSGKQVEPAQCLVVGDAIWDVHAARRAGILSVGLLTGGSGAQELYNAGAMRVFRDAAELLSKIDELGISGK
jgi:phosphoglycolate phosphatase-like HAD superfamily hydrolase